MMDEPLTITGAKNIAQVRLIVLRHRMYLELLGIRFKLNTFARVRKEFGLTGRRSKVYLDYCVLHNFEADGPIPKERSRGSQDS